MRKRAVAVAGLVFWWGLTTGAPPAHAQDAAENDFGKDSHVVFHKRISAASGVEYTRVLGAYDRYIKDHPRDAVAAVEKCLFIDEFLYSEDVTLDSARGDHDACLAQLRTAAFVDHPETQLYLTAQIWGDEAVTDAETLLTRAATWSIQQRARVYERLHILYISRDEAKAGGHAIKAVELDPASSARLDAAGWLLKIGAKSRAKQLISATPVEAWEKLSVYQAAQLLIDLQDPGAAAELLRTHGDKEGGSQQQFLLARALTKAQALQAARETYASVLEKPDLIWAERGLREYLLFECQHGSRQQAQAAYKRLRDRGYSADPFARYRLALTWYQPMASWAWRDLAGLLTVIALFGGTALLPLLLIAPVHHRSLALRLRAAAQPALAQPWQLFHAWYGLTAMLVAGLLATYIWDYASLEQLFNEFPWDADTSNESSLGRAMVVYVVLFALLSVPLLRNIQWRELLKGKWGWINSALIGIASAMLMLILNVIWVRLTKSASVPAALGSDTTRSMQGILTEYGVLALLLVMAVAVPVLEELLFRGVLFTALRRHLPLWIAVVSQAFLFAILHEEWQHLPVFLVFGVVAAMLYRRSEGLLAPIAMHVTFNLLAALGLVAVTHLVDRVG